MYDNRVNDQNCQRHDHTERDGVNTINDINRKRIPTNEVDSLRDQSDQRQTDDDFRRSDCRTQQLCLFISIHTVSYKSLPFFIFVITRSNFEQCNNIW